MFPKIATSRLFNNSKFIIFFQWHSRIIALVSVVFLFHLATLLRYPAPSCDGVVLYAFQRTLHTINHKWNSMALPSGATFFLPHGRIYWLILSTSLTILGKTLFAARLISLLGLIGLVVATYAVGHICVSKRVGMWSAVLTSFAWLTFYSGHLARPDVVSGYKYNPNRLGLYNYKVSATMGFFILGCLVILQMDIHANSLHFVAPITLLATFHTLHHRSWKSLILFWSGILLGIVIYVPIHL